MCIDVHQVYEVNKAGFKAYIKKRQLIVKTE